jgi:hypothetical protein
MSFLIVSNLNKVWTFIIHSKLNRSSEYSKLSSKSSRTLTNCRDTKDQSVLDYAYKTCRPFATFLLFKYGGMIRRSCHGTIELRDW